MRPWTRATTAAMAAHVAFELGSGVGVPFAARVGVGPAAATWAATTGGAWWAAGRWSQRADPLFAVGAGISMAASAAHLVAWPRRRRGRVLPWLVDCEGLGPRLSAAYTPLVYAGLLGGAGALAFENRRAPRWLGPAALALVPVLAAAQWQELGELERRAREHPSWWTRRQAARTGVAGGSAAADPAPA